MTRIVPTMRTAEQLRDAGFVASADLAAIQAVEARYAVAITPEMAALIDPADPADPIARQFVPHPAELHTTAQERSDPIGDKAFEAVKGIVHRYPDRVLLKPLHACPVYCRFCFRREMVGPGAEALSRAELKTAIAYIASRPELREVILTGGDPLLLGEDRLREIIADLSAVPQLDLIRIHTRVPVVDPTRITDTLVRALETDKALFVVIHANHARELTPAAAAACRLFRGAGISLLSQSVLLKGVNNDPVVLEDLFRGLLKLGIKPYYLHHPDLAPGTQHFRLSIEEGQALMRQLRGRVSGLAQPHYVLDVPGGFGKVPIGPSYLSPSSSGSGENTAWKVEDFQKQSHLYDPESDRTIEVG